MPERNIGDKVKFQTWENGEIIRIDDNFAEIKLNDGTVVKKPLSELRTKKELPKYVDELAGKYRVRINGKHVCFCSTLEEAIKNRDEYLKGK